MQHRGIYQRLQSIAPSHGGTRAEVDPGSLRGFVTFACPWGGDWSAMQPAFTGVLGQVQMPVVPAASGRVHARQRAVRLAARHSRRTQCPMYSPATPDRR